MGNIHEIMILFREHSDQLNDKKFFMLFYYTKNRTIHSRGQDYKFHKTAKTLIQQVAMR